MRQFAGSVVGVLCLMVVGCGSSGPGGPNGSAPPGGSLAFGPMQVQTADATSLNPVALGGKDISLTALCGGTITGLTEIGRGKIVFIREWAGGKYAFVTEADGSHQAQLLGSGQQTHYACWSPDGARMALVRPSSPGKWDLVVYELGSHNQTALRTDDVDLTHPTWSPDGQYIACSLRRGSSLDVRVETPPEVGAYLWLTHTDGVDESYPSYSPDSRHVLYARTRASGLYDIFLRTCYGYGQMPLTQHTGPSDLSNRVEPAMSPDGLRIAYTRLFRDAKGVPDAYGRIYLMDADGTNPTVLGQDPPALDVDDRHPTWSWDGREIAFSKRIGNGPPGIWVMNADGSGAHMITNGGDTEPDWCRALSVKRVLVGPLDSPDEPNPPFGAATPLVVCAIGPDGLVASTAIDMEEAGWPTLDVSSVEGLVGMRIQGEGIHALLEDAGWGSPATVWEVPAPAPPGGYIVVFSQITGRIAALIVADSPAKSPGSARNAECAGGRVLLRGAFSAVYAAGDPTRNRLTAPARELTVTARNGEVLAVK
jgi:hypothetical protein